MIVDAIRLEERGDEVLLVGDVRWEDSARGPRELWYAVPAEHATAMRARGDAFLVGCAVLAQHHGERRLRLGASTCPRLVEGTGTALAWLRHWFDRDRPELRIEAPLDDEARPPAGYRSGLFLSGGVDSLYTLYRNHRGIPRGHPHRFRVGILIDGIERYRSTRFDRAIQAIADATGLELVRPSTNLRTLDRDGVLWTDKWLGAALASVAHALGTMLTDVTIASFRWLGNVAPLGCHPLVDPGFSSQTLRVLHAGVELDRVPRLRAMADWDVARRHLRVCTKVAGDALNCGRCRKCLMAMLALIALGRLADFPSFPRDDVDAAEIAGQRLFSRDDIDPYLQLVPELRAAGREDLAEALRHLDADFRSWDEWRDLALADIDATLPWGAPFLLADDGDLGTPPTVHGRRRIQLWQPTVDDAELVAQVKAHAADGVRHLVIAWPAFWWLEFHRGLASWLDAEQRPLVATERVRAYELADRAG